MTSTVSTQVRPAPPPRALRLVPGFLVGFALIALGGMTALVAQGVVWGILGAAGVILSFRFTRQPLTPLRAGVFGTAVVVSSVLSTLIVPEVPEAITVVLCLTLGGAWAISGAAAAWVLRVRELRPSTALNAALGWAGAGAISLPVANAFGFLTPISQLRGDDLPIYGAGFFVFVGFTVAFLGLAPTLGAAARLPMLTVGTVFIYLTLFAAASVGFSVGALVSGFGNIVNVPNLWPPDFGWAIGENGTWWWPASWEFGSAVRANPLLETFRIAIMGSLIGCAVALPVAFMASIITAPSKLVYLIDKGIMSLIRTVPDLFWAMIFVAALSIGPLAGVLALIFFSLGIMGKLLSETVDAVDPGPLEAARATGGSHFAAVRSAVLPQVLPNYVAYALYIFEINIRASVVLGLVGAGGIGRVLETQRGFFRFDRILAIVILIFIIVFVIEQVSVSLRRRLV